MFSASRLYTSNFRFSKCKGEPSRKTVLSKISTIRGTNHIWFFESYF